MNIQYMGEEPISGTPHKPQSKIASLMEALFNTFIGYAIAYFASWAILNWWMKMGIDHSQMNWYTGIMTGVSVVRSYYVRRMWNAEWWKRLFHKPIIPLPPAP